MKPRISQELTKFMLDITQDSFGEYTSWIRHIARQLPFEYPASASCPPFTYTLLQPTDLTPRVLRLASRMFLCINKDLDPMRRANIADLLRLFEVEPVPGFKTILKVSSEQGSEFLALLSAFLDTIQLIIKESRKLFTLCTVFDTEEARP